LSIWEAVKKVAKVAKTCPTDNFDVVWFQ